MFHVDLNKFENAFTHLFLVIFWNNWFPWVSQISRNTQSSRKQFLIFIFWFETVSEDEKSNFKRFEVLSETKCTKPFSNNFSKRYKDFLLEPLIYHTCIIKVCSVRNEACQLDIYFSEATWSSNFRVYSFHMNTKLYAKYSNAKVGDQFHRQQILKVSKKLIWLWVLRFFFQNSSKTHFIHEIPIWAVVWKNL